MADNVSDQREQMSYRQLKQILEQLAKNIIQERATPVTGEESKVAEEKGKKRKANEEPSDKPKKPPKRLSVSSDVLAFKAQRKTEKRPKGKNSKPREVQRKEKASLVEVATHTKSEIRAMKFHLYPDTPHYL